MHAYHYGTARQILHKSMRLHSVQTGWLMARMQVVRRALPRFTYLGSHGCNSIISTILENRDPRTERFLLDGSSYRKNTIAA